MKYIDADLLRNEIERRIEQYWSDGDVDSVVVSSELEEVLDFLDSLQQEQQEVDLEEEMDRFFEEMPVYEHENIFEDTYQMIARHFYKLGKNSK